MVWWPQWLHPEVVERKGSIIFPNQQSNSEFELCFQRNQLASSLSSSVNEFSTEVEELLPVWMLRVGWVVPLTWAWQFLVCKMYRCEHLQGDDQLVTWSMTQLWPHFESWWPCKPTGGLPDVVHLVKYACQESRSPFHASAKFLLKKHNFHLSALWGLKKCNRVRSKVFFQLYR